jgi:hypothetical protein
LSWQGLSVAQARLAPKQLAGVVIVLNDVDESPLARITFDHCQRTIGAKCPDGLRFAIEVVIVDFAYQNSARIFLKEIDLPIEISITFDARELALLVGFDNVRPPVAVSVDGNLVCVLIDPIYPLVRPPVVVTVGNRPIVAAAAGHEKGERHENQ